MTWVLLMRKVLTSKLTTGEVDSREVILSVIEAVVLAISSQIRSLIPGCESGELRYE